MTSTGTGQSRHLSWEQFESLVNAGPPAVERVRGEPRVEIFTDPGGRRIGIRTPNPGIIVPPTPLTEINVRSIRLAGEDFVEVATDNEALYRDFYAFACAVADRLQTDHLPPDRAIEAALEAWTALLRRLVVLSQEKQLGLLGELWLLKRIAAGNGWEYAVASWKGSHAEEHDFSLHTADIEVKTTLSERRTHIIGSLTQLQPNPGRRLYVLSLQFTDAGAGPGATLTDRVREVEAALTGGTAAISGDVADKLDRIGWRTEHAEHYRRRYALRTPPALIPVEENCPAILPSTLQALGEVHLSRILQVIYRVDLTGLGSEDGTSAFLDVLP